jgi:protein-export membrane protein SecD
MHLLHIIGLIPAALLAGAVVGGLLIAMLLGRLADWWRFMLTLLLVFTAMWIVWFGWPPRLGFDLTGGSILVYQLEMPPDGDPKDALGDTDDLTGALQRRIDPGYTGRATVRMSGNGEDVEILIPGTQPEFEQHVQELVRPRGLLEFRIVADKNADERLCELAAQSTDFAIKEVRDESGKLRARWVNAGTRINPENGDAQPDPDEDAFALAVMETTRFPSGELATMHCRSGDDGTIEVLVVEDAFRVSNEHIASVRPGLDGSLRPCLNFSMTPQGAALFGALTGANLPDPANDYWSKLAIILDGDLVSAPRLNDRITERGQITGKFTQGEIEYLAAVLSAGALPINVHPTPLSLIRVPSGKVLVWARWGVSSTAASLLLICVWAVVRYGARGLVAAIATCVIASSLIASLMVFQGPMTFPIVATACGFVLLSAIALVILCGSATSQPASEQEFEERAARGFLSRAWPTIAAFGVLTLVGITLSIVGTGPTRDAGVVLRAGGKSGVIGLLLCCWPLLSMRVAEPTPVTDKADAADKTDGEKHGV